MSGMKVCTSEELLEKVIQIISEDNEKPAITLSKSARAKMKKLFSSQRGAIERLTKSNGEASKIQEEHSRGLRGNW